jgi:hypothetical protein
MRLLAAEAIDHDADENEGHGDEADDVREVLLDVESAVMVGRRSQVDDDVEDECPDRQRKPQVDDPRHLADVSGDGADDQPKSLYYQHGLEIHLPVTSVNSSARGRW